MPCDSLTIEGTNHLETAQKRVKFIIIIGDSKSHGTFSLSAIANRGPAADRVKSFNILIIVSDSRKKIAIPD